MTESYLSVLFFLGIAFQFSPLILSKNIYVKLNIILKATCHPIRVNNFKGFPVWQCENLLRIFLRKTRLKKHFNPLA